MECSCGGQTVGRTAKSGGIDIEYQECKSCGRNNINDMKGGNMNQETKAKDLPRTEGNPPMPKIGTLESRVLAIALEGKEFSADDFQCDGITEEALAEAVANLQTGNYLIEQSLTIKH